MAPVCKNKLAALTSVRFIAAIFIVLAHIRGNFGISPTLGLERFQFAQGVAFFFVLSGFILTYVYPTLEGEGAGKRFLLARFARLWPAHVLALLLSALLITHPRLGWNSHTLINSLASLSMVQSWVPIRQTYHFLNSVAWSISVEFFFYLAFVVLIPNFKSTWPWKLAVAFCLALIACLLCQNGHLAGYPSIDAGALTYHNPTARVFEFVLGMCCGLVFQRLQHVKLGAWTATGIEFAALLLAIGVAHITHRQGVDGSWLIARVGSTIAKWQSWGPGAAPAFGVLIIALGMGQGYLSRILGAAPFVLLGEISYAVYLFHMLLLGFYKQHANAFQGWPNSWLIVGYFCLLLLLSHAVFVAWERPLRSILLMIGKRKQPERAAQVGTSGVSTFDFWTMLTSPSRKFAVAELAVVALILIPVFQYAIRPEYSLISAAKAEKWMAESLLPEPTIEFADRFKLRAATYLAVDGGYRVHLVWESKKRQPLDNWVCVHLLDADQKRCLEIGMKQDPRKRKMAEGAIWEHEVFVPGKAVGPNITTLAVGLWHPKQGVLRSEQADEDREHWRVFLPPPTEQLARKAVPDVILR